jgi:hypothetical protein
MWAKITSADLRLVTHHLQSDLQLLLIICRVTVKWETATACFFRIKTWKWLQKGIKICSGNPKFFRSLSLEMLYFITVNRQIMCSDRLHIKKIGNFFPIMILLSYVYTYVYIYIYIYIHIYSIYIWNFILTNWNINSSALFRYINRDFEIAEV